MKSAGDVARGLQILELAYKDLKGYSPLNNTASWKMGEEVILALRKGLTFTDATLYIRSVYVLLFYTRYPDEGLERRIINMALRYALEKWPVLREAYGEGEIDIQVLQNISTDKKVVKQQERIYRVFGILDTILLTNQQ